MPRPKVNELPFRLVDMNIDDLYTELDDFYDIAEPIPSDAESEVDISDVEEEIAPNTANDIPISDSEDDIPLSELKARFTNNLPLNAPLLNPIYKPPKWSSDFRPTPPPDFLHPSGVPDFIKNIQNPTPYELFRLFITDDFSDHLVFQTNLYAEQIKVSKGKQYVPTNAKEINAFLGLNLLMGIKRSPSYKDYWSSGPDLNDAFICSIMSQKRFGWLLSHIHVNDNSVMPNYTSPNFDKLYKLRPMINLLSANFEKCLLPDQKVAIDESMIKFKGRSSLKQYMPKKPIKRGYKLWVLADKTGYCLKFDIYIGKSTDDTGVQKSLGSRVVHKLTENFANKNHVLFFDNFFNSVQLLEELKQKEIHAVGTVNISRRYLPVFKLDKHMTRGETEWFTSNTGLVAIKWKDKRSVHLLSNFHNPEDYTEVKRKEKDGRIVPVPCPQAVSDYNSNMNYVDVFDQLLSNYKINRRSRKWWHRIFFYFIDASVVNAYCIYKLLNLPKISAKDFRRSIMNGLVSETLISKKRPSTSSSCAKLEIKKSKPFVPPEIRHQSSKHQPERSSRRRCALCSTKAKQIRTEWICSICQVPLCLGKNKSCFQTYHNS